MICESYCQHVWGYRWLYIEIYPRKRQKKSCQRLLVECTSGAAVATILSWVSDFEDVSLAVTDADTENIPDVENPSKLLKKENETIVKKPLAPANRFEDLTTSDQLATYSVGFVPANTEANSEWAVRNFKSWADWRTAQDPSDPVPSDILSSGDAVALNKWLSFYVIETRKLLNATFYLNVKIRGGREHKLLKLSQFTFGTDEGGDYVVYTENGSKNRSGSYKDKPDDNKVVKHYADPTLGEKCYHLVLKLYFSKLPPNVLRDPDAVFYWKAKERVPFDSNACWFLFQPVGRNTLASMVKKMSALRLFNRKQCHQSSVHPIKHPFKHQLTQHQISRVG